MFSWVNKENVFPISPLILSYVWRNVISKYVSSNGTGLLEEERTESPVSPKSEEIEQEVEEQDEVPMPTEMETLDEDKDEPKMEEYETELQVEEPGEIFDWAFQKSVRVGMRWTWNEGK